MRYIDKLKKSDLENIKLIVFDVDGILVPRGTKIYQNGNIKIRDRKPS